MKRKATMKEIMAQAGPIIVKRSAEANEMVTDIGKQIIADQAKWLDDQMKDILPPELYEAGKHSEKEKEIGEYIQRHGISILFVPDSLMIRINVRGKPHSEFVPKLTVDGEGFTATPEFPLDQSRN